MTIIVLAGSVLSSTHLNQLDSTSVTHVSSYVGFSKIHGKKITIVSELTRLVEEARELQRRGLTINTYSPAVFLNKLSQIINETDILVLDEKAVAAIAEKRDIVERILRSGKPVILVAKNPLKTLLKGYSLHETPLAFIPVKPLHGAVQQPANRSLRRLGFEIGLEGPVYALVIKTWPTPNISKLPVTYIVYREPASLKAILAETLQQLTPSPRILYLLNGASIFDAHTFILLGDFIDSTRLSDAGGNTLGISRFSLVFFYATDFFVYDHPELGLWRIAFTHYVKSLVDEFTRTCFLPVLGFDRPNEVKIDVSLYDDQDIVDSWPGPGHATSGPTSVTLTFIPTPPYITDSITIGIDSGITVEVEDFYVHSSYYDGPRNYATVWRWGQSLSLFASLRAGKAGGVAYITAVKSLETEYGETGGAYVKMTVTSSLVCVKAFLDVYSVYSVTDTKTYWFYLKDTTYVHFS